MIKKIRYGNKTIKLPFEVAIPASPNERNKLETVTNPYSGAIASLPVFAVAVYDQIKGSEVIASQNFGPVAEDAAKTMQKGLTWFQKYFTDEYGVLLD